ncbi:MAG: acetyl esterase [Rhodothermales bacterium]|jgi:acetyl esterase
MRILALLLIAVAAAAAEPPFSEAKVESYKTIGDVRLDIHIFAPKGHKASDARPAAVFFFGGGWNGGTVAHFAPHCRWLASRGMVAAVADYRVKSRQNTTPFECVKDGKSAVRWMRANAASLGIDPNRIAAAGGSAGGHVAAATGTVPGLDQDTDQSVSALPNALLLFNPVYDNGPRGYGHERVKGRFKEISPFHNIRKGMPPAIVFLGTRDKLIPVATGEAFKAKMEAVGSRSELHLYQDRTHGFFNQSKGGGKDYDQSIVQLNAFLISLGWLK